MLITLLLPINTHRLPPRRDAPPPIIVKFVCMNSRDLVMRAVGSIPHGARISVRSDLAVRLKEKRHKLAQVGAAMKKENKNIKTRMRESFGLSKCDVWMEFKDTTKTEKWTRYTGELP